MTAQPMNRSQMRIAVTALCAGVLAVAPMHPAAPALPEVHLSAIDLTAAPVPDPADFPAFPDPVSLSYTDYIDTVNQAFADFSGHVQTTLSWLYDQWGSVWTDFTSTMAGGLGAWNDAFTDLGTDLSYWTTEIMDPTIRNLLETMNPSVGAVSLCNVLTFAVEGLQAQFDALSPELAAMTASYSQQIIDGMNDFFDMWTAL